MNSTFLSRFTPSLMQPETLEALFVQRHALAERIVDLIRESIVTPAKHHTLLIGPRGIGKSHLVSLIYYRITAIEELRKRTVIAWLREEEWGVTSFLDLLLRICRALGESHKDTFPMEVFNELYGSSRGIAERKAATLLKEFVRDKTLFLIVENLDELFKGLSSEGQKRLRSFLQENEFCTILATSQSLFAGVSLQTSPFYGFFRIHHLEELTFEEAVTLVKNIASFLNDHDLASFIQTPTGRARIRAVHHLAGGNHRVYVIFSEFLTRDLLDELVNPFIRMLDDLTPYYQARMAWLSPQQRKIVEYLCEQRGAVPVKEIARHCFITHQTAAGQLKNLRDAGYVRSEASGRESFYELREPLMRLCIELKKNRGEPIRLLVDFLRLWHSRTDLEQRLLALQPEALVEREYLSSAIKACDEGQEDLRVAACIKDFQSYASKGDDQNALHVTEELVAIRGQPEDLLVQGTLLLKLRRDKDALAAFDKALRGETQDGMAWAVLGLNFRLLNRHEDALAAYDKALELEPNNSLIWIFRGTLLDRLNQHEDALAAFDKAIECNPKDANAWFRRGMSVDRQHRDEEALAAFDKAIELDPSYAHAWVHRGIALGVLDRDEEALAAFDKAVALDANDSEAWRGRAMALSRLDRDEEALAAFDKAADLEPNDSYVWLRRGMSLDRLHRDEEALAAYNRAVELNPNDGHAWVHRGISCLNLAREEESLRSFDKAINLGETFPNLFAFRAEALLALNRWDEAVAALDKGVRGFADAGRTNKYNAANIVKRIFENSRDHATLRERVKILINLHYKHGTAGNLGEGLVRSVAALSPPGVTPATRTAWREMWQEIIGEKPEFEIPLRLLDVAVRYLESQDQRLLLELPAEERKLLRPLLGIENAKET